MFGFNLFDWIAGAPPIVAALVRALLAIVPILILVPGCIWWERRLLSWMQDRIGPNITGTLPATSKFKFPWGRGTFGLLQPIADGVKLFFKEDITPGHVDKLIYFIAPGIALFPAFALGLTLPWGPVDGPLAKLQPVANVNIGLLYILAISSLGVYGIVLAGYSSNNKYSLMGGLRSSAQLISYELAMGMAVASLVLATGSLKLTDMVALQQQAFWDIPQLAAIQNWFIFTPFGLVAAVIFAVCIVAETNRAPFDLPEAENELIAGYHTEYSSMKFAVFFMGEYAAMFVFSGVFAALFLGGYNAVPINWNVLGVNFLHDLNYWGAPIWFIGKCVAGITFFIWLRATLPRLRYDQLMNLGWRSLLPLAVANFIAVAIWILASGVSDNVGIGWGAFFATYAVLGLIYAGANASRKAKSPVFQRRTVRMVNPTAPEAVEANKG